MKEYQDSYGAGIRYMMQLKGVSQKALAIDCGVTQGTISKLITGKNPGTQRLRMAVADALGVSYMDLFEMGRAVAAGDAVAEAPVRYGADFAVLFEAFPKLREYLDMAQRAVRLGDRSMALGILRDMVKTFGEDGGSDH